MDTLTDAIARAYDAADRLAAWPETATAVHLHLTVVTCGRCPISDVWASVHALEHLATGFELTSGPFLRSAAQVTP